MMDKAYAYLRHARISPRKVKIVCDLIRGKDVSEAAAILSHTPKAASELLLKKWVACIFQLEVASKGDEFAVVEARPACDGGGCVEFGQDALVLHNDA